MSDSPAPTIVVTDEMVIAAMREMIPSPSPAQVWKALEAALGVKST